jgi:hypothetical protein
MFRPWKDAQKRNTRTRERDGLRRGRRKEGDGAISEMGRRKRIKRDIAKAEGYRGAIRGMEGDYRGAIEGLEGGPKGERLARWKGANRGLVRGMEGANRGSD